MVGPLLEESRDWWIERFHRGRVLAPERLKAVVQATAY